MNILFLIIKLFITDAESAMRHGPHGVPSTIHPPGLERDSLLQENGDYLLQENGDKILLE